MEKQFGDRFVGIMKQKSLLSIEELSKLSTPRLLAYYRTHRKIKHYHMCGCGCGESFTDIYLLDEETKQFYNNCIEYMGLIKSMLDKREHIKK